MIIDTNKEKIELGGLSFFADDFKETDSNISWSASGVEIYPNSKGNISGIVGRYSGQLVLNFQKDEEERISSLTFNCKKFKMREKKF